ncbi:nicotinate (nicotinamide) nucleotide adenylyltransferase [Alteromonas pelagimontana]|uniref:Probable nicotinate-nucleotide adenylyltransferase n=1 Tax=Alteromonas pelagimontana TaxID=1858656 RepID=A0A6M4MK48_9ALTE|nr:nicotinate (nicotinamide) nucleotide adenylyltransferase [Alteromonas pelagimontana]QJR82466.1 nicotinate (nicotinamide) nucleotide adenylyltransferase [Alteromonas pelagimontana]
MSGRHPIALLGGTFNPPHKGHVEPALQAISQIGIDQLGLMPCKLPPHKSTEGIAEKHRVNMVKLVCAHHSQLYPELVELSLGTPSYTSKTLRHLRKDSPTQPIIFIMGEDSWHSLPQWNDWRELLKLAHLVVVKRDVAGDEKPAGLQKDLQLLIEQHEVDSARALTFCPAGGLYFAHTSLKTVSSTQLREMFRSPDMASNQIERVADWLLPSVIDYIQQHRLYA